MDTIMLNYKYKRFFHVQFVKNFTDINNMQETLPTECVYLVLKITKNSKNWYIIEHEIPVSMVTNNYYLWAYISLPTYKI